MDIYRKIVAVSLALFVTFSAHAGMTMERKDLPDLKLSIEIPDSLTPMSEEMAKIKYPSENRPQVIYGDEKGKASLGITAGRNPLPANKLDAFKNMMLKMLESLKPKAEAVTVDGHKGWLLTFRSQAADTEILNMMLITSQDNKAVQITFNMTKDLVEQYQEAAKASLLSLKFVK
jgi:hypothetical protein